MELPAEGEDGEVFGAESDGAAELQVWEGELVGLVACGVETLLGYPQGWQFYDLILRLAEVVVGD